MWNVPVTTADAQVGDADVSGRPGGRSDNPFLVIGDTRPFQGSREAVCSGIEGGRPEKVV